MDLFKIKPILLIIYKFLQNDTSASHVSLMRVMKLAAALLKIFLHIFKFLFNNFRKAATYACDKYGAFTTYVSR